MNLASQTETDRLLISSQLKLELKEKWYSFGLTTNPMRRKRAKTSKRSKTRKRTKTKNRSKARRKAKTSDSKFTKSRTKSQQISIQRKRRQTLAPVEHLRPMATYMR